MIRKLRKQDHQQVFPFLRREPSKNLFIIGDIEAYGYEQDFQELWGEFDTDGDIKAVLLRYYETFVVYGLVGYDAEGFAKIILSYKSTMISGDGLILDELEPYIPMSVYEKTDMYFNECTRDSMKINKEEKLIREVKQAAIEDAKRISALESQIAEFIGLSVAEREKMIYRKMEAKAGRTYYIEEGNKIVSAVSTTAENSVSAMIMGVCTLPGYRKRGYVTAILSKVMEDLLKEKEALCLFYDNPEAGAIYKRSGFYDIGIWRIYKKKTNIEAARSAC